MAERLHWPKLGTPSEPQHNKSRTDEIFLDEGVFEEFKNCDEEPIIDIETIAYLKSKIPALQIFKITSFRISQYGDTSYLRLTIEYIKNRDNSFASIVRILKRSV